MSFLDLATGDQGVAQGPQPGEQPHLPTTFGEGFRAAWDENQLFGSSVAQGNAQTRVLDDYVDEIKQKTGTDLNSGALLDLRRRAGPQAVWQYLNDQVGQLKAKNPQLDIAPQSDDEFDQRTIAVSRAARQNVADLSSREGGGAGTFVGGLLGAGTDPVNLVAAPLGGGEGGVLAAALRFGAVAAGTQALNEGVAAPFREQVQPGYLASGEPVANVLTAGAEGFAIGGVQHAAGTALGRLWTRYKTGAWPTSVRDAGNLLESEANVHATNVYPGAEGEVAHREALTGAIDQITKGEPVDVPGTVWRDLDIAAGGAGEVRGAGAFVEQKGDGSIFVKSGDDEGDLLSLRERPDAVTAGMSSVARSRQGQGIGTAIYEKAVEFAADRGLPLRSDISVSPAAIRVYEGLRRRGYEVAEAPGTDTLSNGHKINERAGYVYEVRPPLEDVRTRAGSAADAAQAARAATQESPAPQLPFEATAAEQAASEAAQPLRDRIQQIAERGGHTLAPDEIADLADRFAKMNPDEAANATRDLQVAPRQLADRLAERPPKVDEQVPLAPRQPDAVVGTPEHDAALRADLDRARMTGDVRVPAGVDEKGEPVFRSLDAALDEVDGFKDAAEQIQACAAPAQEAAE